MFLVSPLSMNLQGAHDWAVQLGKFLANENCLTCPQSCCFDPILLIFLNTQKCRCSRQYSKKSQRSSWRLDQFTASQYERDFNLHRIFHLTFSDLWNFQSRILRWGSSSIYPSYRNRVHRRHFKELEHQPLWSDCCIFDQNIFQVSHRKSLNIQDANCFSFLDIF